MIKYIPPGGPDKRVIDLLTQTDNKFDTKVAPSKVHMLMHTHMYMHIQMHVHLQPNLTKQEFSGGQL